MPKSVISKLQYTDDCAIVSTSPTKLQDTLNVFDQAYIVLGLKINAGKTIEIDASQNVYLGNGKALEIVDRFCYLDSNVA